MEIRGLICKERSVLKVEKQCSEKARDARSQFRPGTTTGIKTSKRLLGQTNANTERKEERCTSKEAAVVKNHPDVAPNLNTCFAQVLNKDDAVEHGGKGR